MTAVLIQGVTKSFGEHVAVDNLDLQVPFGTVWVHRTQRVEQDDDIAHDHAYPSSRFRADIGARRRILSAPATVAYLPEERGLYKQMKVRDVCASMPNERLARRPTIDHWLERMPHELGRQESAALQGCRRKCSSLPPWWLGGTRLAGRTVQQARSSERRVLRDAVLELHRMARRSSSPRMT